jgi:hypothetical protein
MLWADPVQGWVDHQFGEFIPDGELIAAGSHPAIFDRSQVTSSRETVYVNFCFRVCATSVIVCLLQLAAMQTANFRFRQSGTRPLSREERVCWSHQRTHGKAVRLIAE